jgi:hypothetical protein
MSEESRSGSKPPSFVCPHCGAESFNPNDIRERYCGRCHAYVDDIAVMMEAFGLTFLQALERLRDRRMIWPS